MKQAYQTENSVKRAWLQRKPSQNTHMQQALETIFYKTDLYSVPRFAQIH